MMDFVKIANCEVTPVVDKVHRILDTELDEVEQMKTIVVIGGGISALCAAIEVFFRCFVTSVV